MGGTVSRLSSSAVEGPVYDVKRSSENEGHLFSVAIVLYGDREAVRYGRGKSRSLYPERSLKVWNESNTKDLSRMRAFFVGE